MNFSNFFFSIKGRIGIPGFIIGLLSTTLFGLLCMILAGGVGVRLLFGIIIAGYSQITFYIRRLHDIEMGNRRSGFTILILPYLLFKKGVDGYNKYGSPDLHNDYFTKLLRKLFLPFYETRSDISNKRGHRLAKVIFRLTLPILSIITIIWLGDSLKPIEPNKPIKDQILETYKFPVEGTYGTGGMRDKRNNELTYENGNQGRTSSDYEKFNYIVNTYPETSQGAVSIVNTEREYQTQIKQYTIEYSQYREDVELFYLEMIFWSLLIIWGYVNLFQLIYYKIIVYVIYGSKK